MHADTLHQLIREFRESRKIVLNIEHRLMLQMAPDYDLLPPLHKLEVFLFALESSPGSDLAKVLWLRSRNAEHWLFRRTNYTRSLGVMSMVGRTLSDADHSLPCIGIATWGVIAGHEQMGAAPLGTASVAPK